VGTVQVGKRTGWGRLPLFKRTSGQQAFRKPGDELSEAETSMTDVLQLLFEAMPSDIEQMFASDGLQEATREATATAQQFRPLIEDVLRQQFIRSQREAEDELARLLSRAYSAVGKATTPTPSDVALMGFRFDRRNIEASAYARTRAGELITNMTDSQREIMRELVTDAYTFQNSPQATARALFDALRETSPSNPAAQEFARLFGTNMNGLTARYEQAVINRGTSIAAELTGRGVSAEKIVERVERETAKYADKLRRARSRTIARTEILRANNEGRLATFRNAQDRGLLPETARKRWQTSSLDVCPICVPLNGQLAPIKEPFDNGLMTPPAHPNCRCSFNIVPNVEAYQVPSVSGSGVEGDPFRLNPGGRGLRPEFDDMANTPLTPPAPPTPSAAPAPALAGRPEAIPDQSRTVTDSLRLPNRPTKPPTPGSATAMLDERIAAIQEVADDLNERVIVPNSTLDVTEVKVGLRPTKTLGGTFAYNGTSTSGGKVFDDPWNEIKVNMREGGTLGEFQTSFSHEFGHRLDYKPGGRQFVTTDLYEAMRVLDDPTADFIQRAMAQDLVNEQGQELAEAVSELIEAVKDTESLRRLIVTAESSFSTPKAARDWIEYATSPHETWARLFAQWTAEVTGNPAMKASILKTHLRDGYQWSDAEFQAIRPLLERVLRLRGIIL